MINSNPYHKGEMQVQLKAQLRDEAERNGRVIQSTIMPGAIGFTGQQRMVALSSIDGSGQVWVSLLFGEPGFITVPEAGSMLLQPSKMANFERDILWRNIKSQPKVGLIALELATRRRLRANGALSRQADGDYLLSVEQAYPNCPKYIARRDLNFTGKTQQILAKERTGVQLNQQQKALISRSDSVFVGSSNGADEQASCDASFRGGDPGFIELLDDNTLLFPDYKGNSMFNTLGNIQLYPKAGLVFIDFEQHKVLQLSGDAEILWDEEDQQNKTGGTKRFWRFSVSQWRESDMPAGVRWQFHELSPHNPKVIKTKEPQQITLKVTGIEQKSQRIKQFRLASDDGTLLPAFEPGAHLPVKVTLPNGQAGWRHYSILSSSDDNRFYEIAVQKEADGRGGSTFIHQHWAVNSSVEVEAPKNAFRLSSYGKHHILIAGGIGITPILSMLRHLSEKGESFELHYSVKQQADLAFEQEIKALAGSRAHFYHTQGAGAKRMDLQEILAKNSQNSHSYICGPIGLISALREAAEACGWSPTQVHFESFGVAAGAFAKPIKMQLQSGKVVTTKPGQSPLDALLEAKVQVPFDCRRGECGLCVTKVLSGEIEHRDVCLTAQEQKNAMCVCVSGLKEGATNNHLILAL